MSKWKTNDGQEFEAETPEEVVEALNNLSLARERDPAIWMLQTAERIYKQRGVNVRIEDYGAFVEDLITTQFIRRVK